MKPPVQADRLGIRDRFTASTPKPCLALQAPSKRITEHLHALNWKVTRRSSGDRSFRKSGRSADDVTEHHRYVAAFIILV
jgi:hypothetical protein